MKRRELREHVFKLLFRVEFNSLAEMVIQTNLFFDEMEEPKESDLEYIETKYSKIMEKLEEIDAILEETSKGWKVSRMNRVDLTILRLAVYEMKYDEDVPVGVAINEAVELSKKFAGDESPAFINGILGQLA